MIPAAFDYAAPETLDEATALLKQHGDEAKILTGGHSLVPLLKMRLARPSLVVDLRKIASLRDILVDGDTLVIGGAATHGEIAASEDVRRCIPMLCETAGEIGDVQVRNAGTIGGSVVHADPAADWPAAMLATGAVMVLHGPEGERSVAAEDFFVGLLESAAKPDEILAAVRVPVPEAGTGGAYRKLAQSASGFALAGAAALVSVKGKKITGGRVAINGVGDHAYRPAAVEQALTGCPLEEAAVAKACADAAKGVDALEDIHASARYRAHLAVVFARRAVLAAAEAAAS